MLSSRSSFFNLEERVYNRLTVMTEPLPLNRKALSGDVEIEILVDTSGSTVNTESMHGSRGRTRFDREDAREEKEDDGVQSDIIIVMEVLGVVEVLRRLEERYILSGIKCRVSTFSSVAREVLSTKIDTIEHFIPLFIKAIIDNLDQCSTDLEAGIKLAFDGKRQGTETILIVATDGHANTGSSMDGIISNINKGVYFSKEIHEKLVSFVVGAGSIRLNEGSGRYFSTFRDNGVTRFEVDDERFERCIDVVRSRTTGDITECNLEYLLSFMGALGNAVYCASCRDLSLLNESVVKFLDERKDLFTSEELPLKWAVDLGIWTALPRETTDELNKEGAVIAYVPAVSSWYCYVVNKSTKQGWQVALSSESRVDIHKRYTPDQEYRNIEFSKAFRLKGRSIINTTTGETFRVDVDHSYQWRCRRLSVI